MIVKPSPLIGWEHSHNDLCAQVNCPSGLVSGWQSSLLSPRTATRVWICHRPACQMVGALRQSCNFSFRQKIQRVRRLKNTPPPPRKSIAASACPQVLTKCSARSTNTASWKYRCASLCQQIRRRFTFDNNPPQVVIKIAKFTMFLGKNLLENNIIIGSGQTSY